MSFPENTLASQMTKDPNPVINIAGQESRETLSDTISLQKTKTSAVLKENLYECDTDKNDASNLQNERTHGIDTLNKTTYILKNSIFVLMTILSLSLLVTQGSVCISK